MRYASIFVFLIAGCSGQLVWNTIEELKAFVAPQSDELVENEPPTGFVHPTLCNDTAKHTAGYLSAGKDLKYFFWLAESRSDPAKDPLIMWLSGGPGCSSQLALFAENGPCSTKDGKTTVLNEFSWNSKANAMWVDQPAGVGFSTGFGTHNENGVAENMLTFLQAFFTQFPQYEEFYIFGESYGGHYVPAIAHRIWQANKANDGVKIPMKGMAVGNGLTNPEEQYKWYGKMGYDGGKAEGGHAPGVYDEVVYEGIEVLTPPCTAAIKLCNAIPLEVFNATACFLASEACNLIDQIPYRATGMNPYDQRIKCETGNLCYDFSKIDNYLNLPDVQKSLGVNKKWTSCNMAVNLMFQLAGDWMHDFSHLVPDLLHGGIKVLIYAGDCDYICNWLGNKAWTKALEWDGKEAFNAAKDNDWQLGGETVARLRSAGNLNFMQVFNAGHMVPMDQPAVAVAMVDHFISGNLQKVTMLV